MMKTLLSRYKGVIKANILLVMVWGTIIITGFFALGAIVGNIEGLIVFGIIHSLAVRLSLVYTAIHIFQIALKRSQFQLASAYFKSEQQ